MAVLRTAMLAGRPVPEAPAPDAPSSYIWYGCDLRSGQIVEELPFTPGGSLSMILGAYTSLQGTLALSDAPPEWERATDPGRTMLVCVRVEDYQPLWAGIVIGRKGGSSDLVELRLVSLEGYFDRRYVGDVTYTQQYGPVIAADLAWNVGRGVDVEGINISISWQNAGIRHDRTYTRDSDQTVYSQLTELMGVENGPEWTMNIRWADNGLLQGFNKQFRSAVRIGASQDFPSAVFDLPGSIIDYEYDEDYSSGRGANHIESFGEGEGASRPQAMPARDEALLAAGWPRYEYRQTFSGVSSSYVLGQHSWEALRLKATGAKIFTVSANATSGPWLLRDWILGDDVAVNIASSPRHPDGYITVARAIGWELDTIGNVITPILAEDAPGYTPDFL